MNPTSSCITLQFCSVFHKCWFVICRSQEGVWRHQSKPYNCSRWQRDILSRFSHASCPLSSRNILRRLLRPHVGDAEVDQARDPHLPPTRSLVLPILPPTPATTLPLSLPPVPHASPLPTSLRVLPHRPQRQERTCQPHGAVTIRLSNTIIPTLPKNFIVLFVLLLLVYVHFPSDVCYLFVRFLLFSISKFSVYFALLYLLHFISEGNFVSYVMLLLSNILIT